MHVIAILLVIIILLLGGWWIFAIGIGLFLAAVGALITGIVWLAKTLWPFLAVGALGFFLLGCLGWALEATGRIKWPRPERRSKVPERPLPPISRRWAARRAAQESGDYRQD